jgi:hypothetical protein
MHGFETILPFLKPIDTSSSMTRSARLWSMVPTASS